MILKKLTIEQFGSIEHFNISFHDELTVMNTPNADDVVQAIGVVTNNRCIINRGAAFAVSKNTQITLKLEISGHPYLITARGQPDTNGCVYEAIDCENRTFVDISLLFREMQLCEEEESLTYYHYDPKNAFSKRLLYYKNPEKYYSNGDFEKRTRGTGGTRTFRACLKAFIQNYDFCDSFTDSFKTDLRSDGCFIWHCVEASRLITELSARDKKFFDYNCYLEINKFWSRFEYIRNINHEKWPMIVDAESMIGHVEFRRLLAKSTGLNRQLIIMNTNKQK